MSRILAIRPEPGLSSTLDAARALGLDVVGEPLFEIRPLAWDAPDPTDIDALLIGSANAILHGGERLRNYLDKPVYAVGQTTAAAVRKAGFTVAANGTGGLQNVLDAVPASMRLLRVAGSDHVPLDLPEGVTIHTVTAYESVTLSPDIATFGLLEDRPIILLHSAIAAQHFASECDRLGLNRGAITLAVLGPRIAQAAGSGWQSVHVSPQPSDGALLEMIRNLCI